MDIIQAVSFKSENGTAGTCKNIFSIIQKEQPLNKFYL